MLNYCKICIQFGIVFVAVSFLHVSQCSDLDQQSSAGRIQEFDDLVYLHMADIYNRKNMVGN
jgi:hypothetical protein